MNRAYRVLLPSFVFASLGMLACRSGNDDAAGGAGSTSSTMSTGTKMTTTTGSMNSTGSDTTSSGMGGSGGMLGCSGPDHTVQEISDGTLGPGLKITVKGVVAMSEKFLVAGSGKNPTSCLWGVFVSAPGLTETGPNTGAIALSYGNQPSIPEGSTDGIAYCPKQEPGLPGDKIPDDVKPGDVLDIVGVTAVFPSMFNCDTTKDPAQTVPMHQLSQVCSVTKTGTATPPAPHKLTAAEIDKVASTTDKDFHDQWGAVQVELDNAVVAPQMGSNVGTDFKLHVQSGIEVSNKATFRAYQQDECHGGFKYAAPNLTLTKVVGFHYLNFCDWEIAPGDKCKDLSPASDDCVSASVTSCLGM